MRDPNEIITRAHLHRVSGSQGRAHRLCVSARLRITTGI
jgi:hypothetical protein